MGAGDSKQKGPIDEKDLAQRYQLRPEQIHALVVAFKSESDSKATVDQKHFERIIAKLKQTNPELAGFDDEIAGLVFSFCDTEHHSKLDPLEIIAALAIFTAGNVTDKAKLVFKTIDRDNSNTLTKDEIRKHASKVLSFSAGLVKRDLKTSAKEALGGAAGAMAGWAIGTALSSMEKQFAEDIVRDVFTFDKDKDGKITVEEWVAAAQTSNTVKALIDPNLSANAWRVVFQADGTADSDAVMARVQSSPKGFAVIFDLEAEAGKYGPLATRKPPAPISVTIVATLKGVSASTVRSFAPTATYKNLLDEATSLSDVARQRIVIKKGESTVDSHDESEPLRELELMEGDKLEVIDLLAWEGIVLVKTLTGKVISIALTPQNTVAEFKAKVQDKEGIPPPQQRLIFKGRQLDDDKVISSYRIVAGTAVHLVLRLV